MTAESTDYGLKQDPIHYILSGYSDVMLYPITVLGILIILYYPALVSVLAMYIGSTVCVICRKIGNLPEDTDNKRWDKTKQILTTVSYVLGKILHGYEICGIENLPKGPAVLVYYHGALAMDQYLFMFTLYRITGRFCISVISHFLFHLPGLKHFFRVIRCIHPTRQECVTLLEKGHLLGVAPGGIREQNYGDNTYKLIWRQRTGFAQVAIDAKVPIVPMFTQNIREGYVIYGNIRPMQWLYEKTRTLVFPMYGLFPVKIRTHIGQPIPYDPNITAAELAEKAKIAIEALRDKHQKIPGSILSALGERFEIRRKNE
ncbi:monoacylglycerol/Diacylglycerol O-acyltransferase isoform X1 [Anolis carolinensis]|uniref:Phospholipid/glycerol acyltransferase domain-containing protein n=1 Tax=Anolis carolinensis TaxID=28377 RepID=A0A803T350_ANOCA|nr:PREDICTED: transmembrane protein 68 [Anolis carolinensis]XP_016851146.1 PREDICTED: transmembrane protein 68 [Anolis carolinensis]|eukprot:XP_008114415.2 PREDICTED: transmembrane protein 68 [Anolis carolinensis]